MDKIKVTDRAWRATVWQLTRPGPSTTSICARRRSSRPRGLIKTRTRGRASEGQDWSAYGQHRASTASSEVAGIDSSLHSGRRAMMEGRPARLPQVSPRVQEGPHVSPGRQQGRSQQGTDDQTAQGRAHEREQDRRRLGLDYKTIQHHLKILQENNVVITNSAGTYGAMYFLTPYSRRTSTC